MRRTELAESKEMIQAKLLNKIQLKMLDIGAPIVVTCKTLSGEIVEVRLQTANLEPDPKTGSGTSTNKQSQAIERHSKGCWSKHGAYVAIMSVAEEK